MWCMQPRSRLSTLHLLRRTGTLRLREGQVADEFD